MFIYLDSRHFAVPENQFCWSLVCILKTLVNTQPKYQPGWWFKGLAATDLGLASRSCSHSVWKAELAVIIGTPEVTPGPAVLVGVSTRDFRGSLAFPPARVISSSPSDTAQGHSTAWGWDAVTKPQPGWKEAPSCRCQLPAGGPHFLTPCVFLGRWCCWLAAKAAAARRHARSPWFPSARSWSSPSAPAATAAGPRPPSWRPWGCAARGECGSRPPTATSSPATARSATPRDRGAQHTGTRGCCCGGRPPRNNPRSGRCSRHSIAARTGLTRLDWIWEQKYKTSWVAGWCWYRSVGREDLFLRSLSFFLKGYFLRLSSFSDSALSTERCLYFRPWATGEQRRRSDRWQHCTLKLTFGQRMGISCHRQPLNLPIYSQFSSYTGLQSKLCCWQGSSVTDLVAKCWITLTVV